MTIKGLFRNKIFLIGASAVLILAIAFGIITFIQKSNIKANADINMSSKEASEDEVTLTGSDLTLEPLVFDSAGVEPESGFKIKVAKDINVKQLTKALSIKPDRSFTLRNVAKNEFNLNFDEPLDSDRIYKFALNGKVGVSDFSWAFQTKKQFRVIRTLPRDKGIAVPVNSGIEITFSYEGIEDLTNYFEITPKVNGRFEYHKKVAVFVPEALQYGTVYTVTIKKGLGLIGSEEKISEDTVFQFQTQLQENSNSKHFFSFADITYNFTSSETPTMTVNADDYYKTNKLEVEVYRYKDTASFKNDLDKYDDTPVWAQRNSKDKLFDKTKLEKFTTFSTKVLFTESPWYQQILQFPDKLPEGYYFVSVTLDGHEYYTHIQVNDLSVYLMTEDGKALVWTNNSKTGVPEQNVSIEVDGVKAATTDSQGIAQLKGLKANNTSGSNCFLLTPQKGTTFVARLFNNSGYGGYGFNAYSGNGYGTAQQYWSYLYLDRGMYLTDDTIRLWGLVKPRASEERIQKLTVELVKYSYSEYSETQSVIVSKEVELTPYGTYSCELPYKNLNPGSYFVLVKSGDKTFDQSYVDIENYTKPAYKLDISQDRKACFIGDTVNLDLQASFFEGSPVSGLALSYESYNSEYLKGINGKVTCSADGKVAFKYVPTLSTNAGVDWRPIYSNIIFKNAKAEETDIRTGASVQVFPRDTMFDVKGKLVEGKINITAKTNKIDISKLEAQLDTLYNYDDYIYRGAPVDAKIRIKVIEKHWEKEKIGQYYDFINKVSRDKYRYYDVNKTISEFELDTVNGLAERMLTVDDANGMNSYYMEISGTDSQNRPVSFTEYIYNSNIYSDYLERMEMSKNYSIVNADQKYKFKTGEIAKLKVMENEKDFTMPQNGKVLYMTLKNGILDYFVKGTNSCEIAFDKDLIPNAYVKAVYFNGKDIYNASNLGLYYDYSEKALDISIKPDRSQYKPGDTVNLDVSVADKSGKPYEADVNLSVVDEAFFALREQWVDTAGGIYNYVFNTGITNEYISYNPFNSRYPMAECGEGGDSMSARSDFRDNAFFGSVTTDTNGKGKFSFKLPDNLTSWRVTGQCVTNDLKAGNSKININCKLPFFTNLIFNDLYLTGDSPGISLRSYGTEVTDNGLVKYEVTIEGANGYKKVYNKEQNANEFCNINMDSLKAGEYSVTVAASYGSHKDAVKKSFSVVDNILEAAKIKYIDVANNMDLTKDLDISANNSILELSFYNKNLSRYNRVLNSLNYSFGHRVDQVLSRKLAAEYQKKYFGKESIDTEDEKLLDYQTNDGGIALLTYDSSNPELTAKIAALGSEYFSSSDLEAYFNAIIENKQSVNVDIAASYFGLAALGRPVLIDVNAYLKESNISLKEKLYLGMALCELGDYPGARAVYDSVLKDYGKNSGEFKYIDQGKDKDDIVEMTAMCSLMAMKLNTPERDAFFDYVNSKSTDDILVNLEKLIYIQNTLPEAETTGSLSVTSDNKKENIKLSGTERKTMAVTYDALKNMKISDVNGEIEVAAKYIGPLNAVYDGSDKILGITRVYKVNGKETSSFKHSDVVQVELKINLSDAAPEGYYQVTDILPSGLRYMPDNSWNWERWFFEGTDKQKVTFGYLSDTKHKGSSTIRYLARVVSPGTYTADNAVIKHAKSQAYSFSGRNTVNINPD